MISLNLQYLRIENERFQIVRTQTKHHVQYMRNF